MKRCYYEVLEVDKKATASQIKTNYRKLALKYHPDKNPNEQAKAIFLELTEAYDVLSDPNERTWYDNNRQKLLFNKEQMSKEDLEMYSFGFNIWNYFVVSCFKGFDDSETGFYSVYRNVFEKIKTEETKAFHSRDDLEEEIRKFQGFGDSKTNMEKVIKFYEQWENFSTYKTFIWSEQYDTREAQNRWVRREMEKQNKKERVKQKKTYIKTIKDLILFLKKRDPRYRQYLMKVKEQEQNKAKEKILKEQQKKRQKEEMKKTKQQLEQQRFKEAEEYFKQQNQMDNLKLKQDKQDYEHHQPNYQFYCHVCEKEFKSQNQFSNHEKSKLHKQAVKDLQKEVATKQQLLQSVQKQLQATETKEKKKKKKKKKNGQKKDQKDEEDEQQDKEQSKEIKEVKKLQQVQETKQAKDKNNNNKKKKQTKKQQSQEEEKPIKQQQQQSDDDQDAFMNAMLGIKGKKKQDTKNEMTQKQAKKKAQKDKKLLQSSEQEQQTGQKKLGKAKLKKLKKVQQEIKPTGFKCNVCYQSFPSKTKLFDHVTKLNHASQK